MDYVEFESQEIVSQFIDYWRKTGKQRVGYMLGRYEKYDGVQLGVKTTVCAIYEPPQVRILTMLFELQRQAYFCF